MFGRTFFEDSIWKDTLTAFFSNELSHLTLHTLKYVLCTQTEQFMGSGYKKKDRQIELRES